MSASRRAAPLGLCRRVRARPRRWETRRLLVAPLYPVVHPLQRLGGHNLSRVNPAEDGVSGYVVLSVGDYCGGFQ